MKDNYNDVDRGQFTGPIFFSKSWKWLLIFLLIAIASSSWYFLNKQVLVITPISIAGEKIIIPLSERQWYLSYTHSVQQTVVEEWFRALDDDTFAMYRTRYSSFGVGLPFLPGEGELVFLPNETMQLDLYKQRIFPVVKLWTGVEAKVKLVAGTDSLELYEKYPTGTLVQISTCKRYKLYCQ